ncbi:MAG: selenocysteine-specific translation elongation factor [Vallitalea sp.]|nr:selenocysteine-specific translation elongation factor [Vallitalea sp.]
MEHLVIGTAGHVDHGKTELVKALTGYDTDRLEEEKRRGVTIELGFAPYKIDDTVISIVDVPGHERFIKTMVSGASGMDMALIVISSDEGIMPQTIEHINIISMLNITSAIVVLTKIDLVSKEHIEQLKNTINDFLKDTIYSNAPICEVSSKLNTGIDNLNNNITQQAKHIMKKRNKQVFRMSVDRVFTMKGHGTIVTGTISGGKINKDDIVEILPSKITSKVRNIQVHGADRDEAYTGQRCAINLAKVSKSEVIRGHVLTKPNTVDSTTMIDAIIHNVTEDNIKYNQKVKVNIGTTEVIGKLSIVGKKPIKEKESGYARIRLERPIVTIRGDRFIIRSMTPVITIGGGKVLAHKTFSNKIVNKNTNNYYQLLDKNNIKGIIQFILQQQHNIIDIDTIYEFTYENKQHIEDMLNELVNENNIIKLNSNEYVSTKTYKMYKQRIIIAFDHYYRQNKYNIYMSKEQLRSKHFDKIDIKAYDTLIGKLIKDKFINVIDDNVVIDEINRKKHINKYKEVKNVEQLIIKSGLKGYNLSAEEHKLSNYKVEDVIKYLIIINKVVRVDDTLYIHITSYNHLISIIKTLCKNNTKITVQQVRDKLGIGRKYTIILLEYLDKQGITKRIDNYRVFLDNN